ncbi:MAG: hypothetical protein KAH07_02445 [Flavobacteriaceae bacterium]|nr:hypothetical protein [Flavobacteriaceae bacterium]
MIANFFKKTKPIQTIFISLLFLLFYLLSIFFVEKSEFSLSVIAEKVGTLLLFFTFFIIIRFIKRKNQFSGQDSYLLLFMVLLFAIFPGTMVINKVLLSHFILLVAFRRIYSMRSFENIDQKIFDSGFWIGVASLFYMWSAIFVILVLIAIMVYSSDKIRGMFVLLIAYSTPLFLSFTYYFWNDNTEVFYNKLIFEYSFSNGVFDIPKLMIPLVFVIICSLGALAILKFKINNLSNNIKPSLPLLLGHYLIGLYMVYIIPNETGTTFVFVFIPVVVFIANALQVITNKIIREVFVYSFLLMAFAIYFI